MQSWGRSSRSLFCSLRSCTPIRPEQHCSVTTLLCSKRRHSPILAPHKRHFTTSPVLRRTKRDKKAKGPQAKPGATPNRNDSLMSSRQRQRLAEFDRSVEEALVDVRNKLLKTGQMSEGWKQIERRVLNALRMDEAKSDAGPLLQTKRSLQRAMISAGAQGIRNELEYLNYADRTTRDYSTPNLEAQKKVADLRYPAEWYPAARSIQRTVHLHVGPTNSGKTYHALKRLEASKSGFYAGPLRLLAQEVYHRFKTSGIPCSLVTGDEVKVPEDGQVPRVMSNTVEMVSLGQDFDVGVIDEIQMISNPQRGWAWTRAVLGARVKELHLCGETRAVPLIRELCALTGDNLEIHRYDRLNPLQVMPQSLKGNLNNLQKGDCLVSFSRVGIHALKADIERLTGRRAAIVYGGLPAEIRTQQANLFNNPDNDYDFLVASDAIGMGLNLSCKRVIFETLIKRLPGGLQRLSVPEIKQIGGRAGRYRPASATNDSEDGANVGLVTSLEEVDLPYIVRAMGTEPPPLRAAGIVPTDATYKKFATYFPRSTPFEYLLRRVREIAEINPLFFMCDAKDQLANAEIIDNVTGLRLQSQLTLMAAPMDTRTTAGYDAISEFADCVAENSRGRFLDILALRLEVLQEPVSGQKEYLHELENLHKAIILYSWLGFRFGGVFTDRTLAVHVKELVEERMIRALTEFSANKKLRKDASLRRQIALQKQLLEQGKVDFENDGEPEGREEEVEEDQAEEGSSGLPTPLSEIGMIEAESSDSPNTDLEADLDEDSSSESSHPRPKLPGNAETSSV
ncbi:ATP-dependent RNA helicase DHX8 [Penicillium atrosanguineum]|uniref:ATP-dependent RNA helicase DHX8 n=1 Tax=Penicillium atrosanguineum TaxID=1132637 RepID=UPI0023942C5B|nr:ATP-dependent RNA helicase DHX8 [Penicillium atrosanguineum]KAJ5310144.1 ATP-dependent RNA helicase DHX8 [Penicillium atrosanguineum]